MIKKVLGILAIAGLLASCGNTEQKKETSTEEAVQLSVENVLADVDNYVGKEVVVMGTVNHVCKHGGKRMFIIDESNPDVALKITPNDQIGVFEKELEGSHVVVTGIIVELRIDEAYVASLEEEEGAESEAIHDHSGGTHEEDPEAEAEAEKALKEQYAAMRQKISESENGYYSQYWIEASKFEVIVSDHDHDAEGHTHEEGEEEHEHTDGDGHDHEGEESDEHTH